TFYEQLGLEDLEEVILQRRKDELADGKDLSGLNGIFVEEEEEDSEEISKEGDGWFEINKTSPPRPKEIPKRVRKPRARKEKKSGVKPTIPNGLKAFSETDGENLISRRVKSLPK
ncbi:hypothetical protein ACJ73_07499, partial [Blastomyces percursus]